MRSLGVLSAWLHLLYLPKVVLAARREVEMETFQKVSAHDEDMEEFQEPALVGSLTERFHEDMKTAKAFVSLSPKEAAVKSRERECVLGKAELFGRIYKKFGGQWSDMDQTKLVENVIAFQEFEEQKDNAWASFSKKEKLLRHILKGKKLKSIQAQIKDVNKNISDAGFNYAAVHKRCGAFEDEDVYACMQQKHQDGKDTLRDYVDAEDMLAHKKGMFSSSKECSEAKTMKQKSEKKLKKLSINVKKLKKECKAEVEAETEKFMKFVGDQLRATKTKNRRCIEDAEKGYCPEGTAPRSSREIDPKKGAKWFAIGYFGSYGGGWALMSVALALIGAPAGPAGMLAGFALGSALAQFIPTTPIGTALFAWNAIGPNECACFPRDCVMSDSGTCIVGVGLEDSSNPFGQALPYLSMKCVEVKKGECSLQSCERSDYQAKHPSVSSIYGKIGVIEGGTYNCLASEPKAGKALSMQETLPNGESNTAKNRAEIFKSLKILEKKDPPTAPASLMQSI